MGPEAAWIPELGGPTQQLLFTPEYGAWKFPTSWTPDGRSILVTVRREGESANIALFPLEGDREPIPLVDTSANEVGGRISPDGRWLVYVSNESGHPEIWIRPVAGPGAPVQLSSDGGTEPVWAWDSDELFYRSGLDMMVVEVSGGPLPVLGPPHEALHWILRAKSLWGSLRELRRFARGGPLS